MDVSPSVKAVAADQIEAKLGKHGRIDIRKLHFEAESGADRLSGGMLTTFLV